MATAVLDHELLGKQSYQALRREERFLLAVA